MGTVDYCYSDIVNSFRKVGIQSGDDVFVHSNLAFFGRPEGCDSADELNGMFVRAFREVLGKEGTLIVPTYSYSYCHDEIYDPYESETPCGMLPGYMIREYPENRSLDPNFSICGIGEHMRHYLSCNIHEAFGEGCFWERFLERSGKVLCMNVHTASTMIHYVECKNRVSYRYPKAFNGQSRIGGKLVRDYAVHYVCDGGDDAPAVERIGRICEEGGFLKKTVLGKGRLVAFSAKDYDRCFSALLKTRPRVLCKTESFKNEEDWF